MIVRQLEARRNFTKQFKQLPERIQKKAEKKLQLFRNNPLHPSLRLHPLKGKALGLWSISVNKKYRIIFKRRENGDVLFVAIGKHDIYDVL